MSQILIILLSLMLSAFSSQANAADLIKIDGSSTVFPITEAVSEEFQISGGGAKVMVGIAGTGGGFKRFCRGETDISNASRPIKASEIALCKENNIDYVELPVAFDGLSVVVNPKNTWVDYLTVAELKKMWEPSAQGTVTKWSQIRSSFPDRELKLFGAGTDSGTFDYFTEVINGKAASSRGDYTASEDDNVLVEGVSSEDSAIGYFGLAYYEQNKDKVKVVPIDGGKGPIEPSLKTVMNGSYSPLSRPLFIYVNSKAVQRESILKYIEFYLENAPSLVEEVGYIPMNNTDYEQTLNKFRSFAQQ